MWCKHKQQQAKAAQAQADEQTSRRAEKTQAQAQAQERAATEEERTKHKHKREQKQKKKEGIVFINVLHTRKPTSDKEGKLRKVTEYDVLGSGTYVQSADANIVINRDKMAECPIERNTTCIDLPKIRGGTTGHVCDIYYDYKQRSLHDLEDHMAANPELEATRIPKENAEDKKGKSKFKRDTSSDVITESKHDFWFIIVRVVSLSHF